MDIQTTILTRPEATALCRNILNENGLDNWHVRLSQNAESWFYGLCEHNDECIILNAHFIDQSPKESVINLIKHEVAHALVGAGHKHDDVWRLKAHQLGCDDTSECASYNLSPDILNAIRSGADIVVTFEEEKVKRNIVVEETIRKPKYEVRKLEARCHVCQKIIKHSEVVEFVMKGQRYKKWKYECGHYLVTLADSQTLFEEFITVEHRGNNCQHEWDKNKCLKCNAFRPFPFQIEGMRAIERANGRLGVFDEMGLGKTIQSLGWIYFHPEALPALYVVKSGIKYQWMSQIFTWLGDKYLPQVLSTSKENFLKGFRSYIISYDILRRLSSEQIDSLIEKVGIKTIVLDECQQIKNPDSTRTQLVRKLAKQVPYVLPLSGTPWKNRGSEFFVALNMLDPKRFWSFEGFKEQWVDYYWENGKQKEGGIIDPARFREYIKDIAIRRERIHVMPELPTISRNRLVVEVPENVRKVYQQYEQNVADIYNESIIGGEEGSFETQKKINAQLMQMRQIIALAKIPATVEYAQDFLEETNRKLGIFLHHKECGERIYEQMRKWCLDNGEPEPLRITADMNGAERFEVQEKFNSNKYRLLIASQLASGEGLNLQTCSDCVMHERQWNPANEEQVESRFIRIGQQSNAVNAMYIHADKTVDTDFDGIVERKRIQFHNVMNKGEMPKWGEKALTEELIQRIIERRKAA
jgi:superfamily II DNA or RNA helicase